MPNREFDRYKQATRAHQSLTAGRMSLGLLRDPTVEHLAAIDQADAALEIATIELNAARQDYLRDPGEAPVATTR